MINDTVGACRRFANSWSSTNRSLKSETDVNLSTSEALETIFNILLKQIDKQIDYKIKPDIAISHNMLAELCFFIWVNDTYMEELVCFTEFSTKILLNSVQKFIEIYVWLLPTFLICLHNQLGSFNSIIVQWMVASFSNFYSKTWVGFCLNIRKRFFLEFSF